jgi:hypothetical protein
MTKSTLTAVFLSCLFPGLGLFYLGEKDLGGLFLLLTLAGIFLLPLLLFWPAGAYVTYLKAQQINQPKNYCEV